MIQYADKGVYFNGATLQDLTCSVFCVKNSVIQYNNYGLYLTGAAKPMLTGNRIINNSIWGIYLAGSGTDATSPNPVMTNNDIYQNYYYFGTYYNANGLYIYNYSSTTGIHINATGNWWGRAPTQSYGTSTASGSDILISSSTTPLSVANYSGAATQSLFTAVSPPIVTLATSGAPFNAPATVTLNANATVSNGTISSVDFYNGSTWLGNATSPVGNVYSFAWSNVPAGSYTLSARAANNIGLATTSTPVAVTVLGDVPPTISLTAPVNGSVFYAPAMVPLGANVSTANSSRTITKVGFYNGAILLGESTTSPYGYAWSNVAAGAYSITAVATDNTGATTVSAPVTITVNPVTLSIDPLINNTIVNDDNMLVAGSFIAPPNTGVTVNGLLATLFKNSDGSYTYYANNVPLTIGANTIAVNLVSQDGQTATTNAFVTSTGSPGFRIRADRVFDILPNGKFEFEYQNTSGLTVTAIQVDTDGNGTIDSTIAITPGLVGFSVDYSGYTSAAKIPVIVKVLGAGNTVLYTTTQAIVINTQAAQDAFVKPVITGMFSLLKQGNKTAAMQTLSGEARDTYGGVFDALMPYMAMVSGELSNVEAVSNGSDIASHAILRAEGGVNKVYIINSIKDKDGVWRIDSM